MLFDLKNLGKESNQHKNQAKFDLGAARFKAYILHPFPNLYGTFLKLLKKTRICSTGLETGCKLVKFVTELENLLAGINADSVNTATESSNASLQIPQSSTNEKTKQSSAVHQFKSPTAVAASKQSISRAAQQPNSSASDQTNLFPDSQEFNQLIINATNISGHPVVQSRTGNDRNSENDVTGTGNQSSRAKDISSNQPCTFGNR